MSGGSSFFGLANPGATPRGQPSSKPQPESYLKGRKRDIVRPLPRMQINNEQRRRGEEAGLRAQQPAIRPPVEGARALIQLLGVAPHVAPVGTERARVLRGATDVEQRIPLAAGIAVLSLGDDYQRYHAGGGEPFAAMHDGTLEGRTRHVGRSAR